MATSPPDPEQWCFQGCLQCVCVVQKHLVPCAIYRLVIFMQPQQLRTTMHYEDIYLHNTKRTS